MDASDPFADLIAEFAPKQKRTVGNVTYHDDLEQGTDAWLAARCGLLTASEMKLILTPTLKVANNDKTRAHLYELLAQRITKYVEPMFVSDDMLRGYDDEIKARALYAEHFAPVVQSGFLTNSKWGFTLGYSPDGLVGDDGLIECKSRRQKYQVQTIIECGDDEPPSDYLMQLQTGLLVSERQWIDLISYSGGLPMCVMRVHPDLDVQAAILEAAEAFEGQIADKLAAYQRRAAGMIPTKRTIIQEMFA